MYTDQRRPGAPLLQNIKEEPHSLHDNMGDKDMYSGMLRFSHAADENCSQLSNNMYDTDLNGQMHPMHQGHHPMSSHSASQNQHREKERSESQSQPKNLKSSTQVN